MVEQRQGFSVPSAVLPNTVPQVLPKREYASSFSSDPEFDLLLACCACDEKVERVQNASGVGLGGSDSPASPITMECCRRFTPLWLKPRVLHPPNSQAFGRCTSAACIRLFG